MQLPRGGGGGGGYSPQILVGMCLGKVNKWQGLRNELPVERENGGLRNELEPFWAWKWGAPERAWAVLAWKWDSPELPGRVWLTRGAAFGLSRPWEAMNGLKLKKFWKWWSPERQNPPKNVKWWCSGTDFLEICENYMLRKRKFRAENGGLSCGTYPICIHNGSTPPPPGQLLTCNVHTLEVQFPRFPAISFTEIENAGEVTKMVWVWRLKNDNSTTIA